MFVSSDRNFFRCGLSAWVGDVGCCRWCNRVLCGRQRRWCCSECAVEGQVAHWFGAARARRLVEVGFVCERCGFVGGGGVVRFRRGVPFVVGGGLEVNHRVPCLGLHDRWSCLHHQDNLEVLCPGCHREVTRSQWVGGLFGG